MKREIGAGERENHRKREAWWERKIGRDRGWKRERAKKREKER